MDINNRSHQPKEYLAEMHAHKGVCKYCGNVVKMLRDPTTAELRPDICFCIGCAQRYYMLIKSLDAWEAEQWEQKAKLT